MSRFDRQGFLGADSEQKLGGATLGIVGLGGGGSHIAQQTPTPTVSSAAS